MMGRIKTGIREQLMQTLFGIAQKMLTGCGFPG